LEADKRVRLEEKRKRHVKDFWHNYIGPSVGLQVSQVLREYERVHRHIPDPDPEAYR
jgi:hypothetical protein